MLRWEGFTDHPFSKRFFALGAILLAYRLVQLVPMPLRWLGVVALALPQLVSMPGAAANLLASGKSFASVEEAPAFHAVSVYSFATEMENFATRHILHDIPHGGLWTTYPSASPQPASHTRHLRFCSRPVCCNAKSHVEWQSYLASRVEHQQRQPLGAFRQSESFRRAIRPGGCVLYWLSCVLFQIGLTAFDNGAVEIWTHDRRFVGFAGLLVHDPLK